MSLSKKSVRNLDAAGKRVLVRCDFNVPMENGAKNLPAQQDMIAAVTKSAPRGLAEPLAELNENIRHVLHSYVHTGLHPIRRRLSGFPSDLVLVLLKQSNQLLHHAYRVMALLHKSQPLMDQVTSVQLRFTDCVKYHQDTNDVPGVA